MTKFSLRDLGRFGLVLAAGVSPVLAQSSTASGDPCAALNGLPVGTKIKMSVARACLAAIPCVKKNAVDTVDGLKKYLEFQSTLSYLKNPPKSSSQKPVDLMAQLDKISSDVQAGKYDSQLDFETDVSNLLRLAHDGHLSASFTTSSIIAFSAPFAIVSLSKDGKEVPKVYASEDVVNLEAGNEDISEISKLDGEDVFDHLSKLAEYDNSQSPDTRWNDLMLTRVRNGYSDIVAAGGFYLRNSIPDKDTIKLEFANGTAYELPYTATVSQDFSTIQSAEDIYNTFSVSTPDSGGSGTSSERRKGRSRGPNIPPYSNRMQGGSLHPVLRQCREDRKKHEVQKRQESAFPTAFPTQSQEEIPPVQTQFQSFTESFFPSEPTATASETGVPVPTNSAGGVFPGYDSLTPVVRDPQNEMAGFYLSDDTAVLVIVGFEPIKDEKDDDAEVFQRTLEDFLADCKKTKKNKLIIDVHGNGGGTVGLGYDTLKQLFPSLDPFDAQRFRASAAAKIEGEVFSDLDVNNVTKATQSGLISSLRYQNMLQIDGTPFAKFGDFFGPVTVNGDKFTVLSRLNLDDPFSYGTNINITGHNSRSDFSNEPGVFDPKNVVLLTDGVCASTCTIFAEVMQNQLGIKVVAVGGRPREGGMAAIGGTRGCQAMTFDGLVKDANAVINGVGQVSAASTLPPLKLPLDMSGGVNYCDQVRNNTKDEVPLQFIDEPADCRIYYTPSTWLRPLKLWKQVHDMKWGNAECAQGSLKGSGSIIGSNGNKTDSNAKKSDAPSTIGLKGSSSIALISALVAAALVVV